jgi:HK97 family phage major capsid protein
MNKELRKLLNAQNALLNKAIAENRGLTPEEEKENGELETKIENLKKAIELQNKVAKNGDEEEKLEVEEKTPVNDKLHAEPKNHAPAFKSMGEFLGAVKDAADPYKGIDNRLRILNASGLNEQVNSEGGFLVETTYVKELMQRAYDRAPVASKVKKIPLGPNSNRMKLPAIDETSRANGSRLGGVQAYWTGEAQTVTATKPKYRNIDLELEKLMALCYATDELLADTTALDAWIKMAFEEEMAFKLDDAIINGTGVGMPLGILPAPCLVSQAKENNQAAATIVHQNISKMWNRLWAKNRANAAWFINQDIENQLADMTFGVGTGGELSPLAKEYSEKGTLKGRPVIPIEQCATLGTVGDIILADMSQYLMIEKGNVDAQVSMHVRFLYDEQVFRFVYRADGEPSWNSALTPYKGTTTYSPFVALATRS